MSKFHVTACSRLYEENTAGVCLKERLWESGVHGREDLSTGMELGKVPHKKTHPGVAYCKLKIYF